MKKLFFILVSLFIGFQSAQAAVDPKKAEAFMANIGAEVISLLTDKSITDQQRADKFEKILESSFNVKAGAKFVLGRYWKQANEAQRQEFLNLFRATTVASYATRFKDYTSQKFEITGSRMEADGGVTVLSKIIRPKGTPISLDWKIFESNGQMRIYDVVLEGISMSVTLRSEYAAVIQQGGGQIQALITALQKKLNSYDNK
jgi:phospholipid transport system substrate-binding protein